MAKVFLDANIYIDLIKRRTDRELADFQADELFISPLSIHILTYVYKYRIPDHELDVHNKTFNLVSFESVITNHALTGPTDDFEDNVQLHSAAQADCDIFLTADKKLLAMKFFGTVKIDSRPS